MLTKDEISAIKANLPTGWTKSISEATGHSTIYVSHVVNGRRVNDNIIRAAIILAKKNKDKNDELSKQIKSL